MTADLLTVEIRNEPHIVVARRRARDIAQLLGFEHQDGVRIATTVSEMARNAFRYAGGGRVEFRFAREPEDDWLEIAIRDRGPGISDLQAILDGRYQSSTGMGLGLLSGRRLMDRFTVDTSRTGTTVRIGKKLGRRATSSISSVAAQVAEGLFKLRTTDAVNEIEDQNRELLQTLAELQRHQAELSQLNRELEETNRGVVALYAELDDRAQEIQKVADLKSRFLSNITHEFRTPLNSIISLSRMLLDRLDGDLTTEQEKQTRFINRAARDLGDLVNDLLDLAKADAGKVEVHPSAISIEEVFSTLRGMLRPLLEVSTTVMLVFEPPPQPVELVSDERKLSQILRNLISNALKYTPHGEVRVTAQVEQRHIVFCVKDTGIGIPPDHHDKIFEEFYQVRNPLQQKVKGTGLGLALSKRLVGLLGGTIAVESTVGRGSTFRVTLPLTPPETAPAPVAPASAPPPLEPEISHLVLFVDDNVNTLFGYERMLEHTTFKAILARDPVEARNILQRVTVTAIVVPSPQTAERLAGDLPASPSLKPAFIIAGTGAAPARALDQETLLASLEKLTAPGRLTALIIDEDEPARLLLRTMLEEFQLSVLEASSPAEGLAAIREHQPSITFLELPPPPGENAVAFIGRLQASPFTQGTALIIHSSKAFTDEERDFFRVHASAMIRKAPISDSTYRTALIHTLAEVRRRHSIP